MVELLSCRSVYNDIYYFCGKDSSDISMAACYETIKKNNYLEAHYHLFKYSFGVLIQW